MKPTSCPDIMVAEVEGLKAVMFLDELKLDEMGTVIVMLCRMWDINAPSGRYLSTDFLVSDAKVCCHSCLKNLNNYNV